MVDRPVERKKFRDQPVSPSQATRFQSLLEENRLLKAELHQRTREFSYFINAGRALAACLEFKKALRIILSTSRRLVRCEDWSLLLRNEREDDLYYELAKGTSFKFLKKIRYKIGEGPAGFVADKGLPFLFPDDSKTQQPTSYWERYYPHLQVRSLLCLPISSKNRVIGVIQMINPVGRDCFNENDLEILKKLVDQASLAIERSDIYQKMSDLVTTDDLTHVYNRRYLDHTLDLEIKRSRRYGFPFSLLFMDLDFFKRVNDEHGHLLGSQVLIEVANILSNSLRAVDVVTRYGGDEFVVLLPATLLKNGGRVAERLRHAIREFKFLEKEGLSLQISASFGVSEFPLHTENKTTLIHLADQAMYQSKITGRDRVSFANIPTPTISSESNISG